MNMPVLVCECNFEQCLKVKEYTWIQVFKVEWSPQVHMPSALCTYHGHYHWNVLGLNVTSAFYLKGSYSQSLTRSEVAQLRHFLNIAAPVYKLTETYNGYLPLIFHWIGLSSCSVAVLRLNVLFVCIVFHVILIHTEDKPKSFSTLSH